MFNQGKPKVFMPIMRSAGRILKKDVDTGN